MFKKIIAVFAALFFSASAAFSVDYSGKTVTIWVPFKAGGGTDAVARALTGPLSANLPGNPSVVVKNVTEGGGIGSVNTYVAKHGKDKDGLVVLATSGSTQLPFLFKDKRVRYDYKKFVAVHGAGTGGVVYVRSDLGVKDIVKDFSKLKGKKLLYGSQGISSLDAVPALAFDMLGLPVKIVYGMKGRKGGRAAIMRGETTIDYQTTSSYKKHIKPLVDKGEMVPLMTWGVQKGKKIVRDPNFPNLPCFTEVYEKVTGKKPSGAEFQAWSAMFAAGFTTQKFLVLPKGTKGSVVKTWQKAAEGIVADKAAMKVLNKKLGTYPHYIGNKDLKVALKNASTMKGSTYKYLKNWLASKK